MKLTPAQKSLFLLCRDDWELCGSMAGGLLTRKGSVASMRALERRKMIELRYDCEKWPTPVYWRRTLEYRPAPELHVIKVDRNKLIRVTNVRPLVLHSEAREWLCDNISGTSSLMAITRYSVSAARPKLCCSN